MAEEEILKKLRQIAGHYLEEPEKLDLDSLLVEDCGLNSLELMSMAMEIEDAFKVTIPMEGICSLRTPKDMIQEITKLTQQPSVPDAC